MANRLGLPRSEEQERYEARMSLIEHLDELRSRIFKVLIALIVATVAAAVFQQRIFEFLLEPAPPGLGNDLNFTAVTEAFLTVVKMVLYTAVVVTVPIMLYQMWMFVAPAVGDMGRAFTYVLVGLSSSLFLAGMAFGYYVVLPFALEFMIGFGGESFEPIITGNSYLSFVTRFLLAFGISFELPAATYVGARLELIDAPTLRKFRRHALIVNVILAAALTPADPISMILMAIPLVGLYEVSIFIARYVNPVSESDDSDILEEYLEDEGDGYYGEDR